MRKFTVELNQKEPLSFEVSSTEFSSNVAPGYYSAQPSSTDYMRFAVGSNAPAVSLSYAPTVQAQEMQTARVNRALELGYFPPSRKTARR